MSYSIVFNAGLAEVVGGYQPWFVRFARLGGLDALTTTLKSHLTTYQFGIKYSDMFRDNDFYITNRLLYVADRLLHAGHQPQLVSLAKSLLSDPAVLSNPLLIKSLKLPLEDFDSSVCHLLSFLHRAMPYLSSRDQASCVRPQQLEALCLAVNQLISKPNAATVAFALREVPNGFTAFFAGKSYSPVPQDPEARRKEVKDVMSSNDANVILLKGLCGAIGVTACPNSPASGYRLKQCSRSLLKTIFFLLCTIILLILNSRVVFIALKITLLTLKP